MKPGIYTMTAEEYHSDPADVPSLTASIAHIICSQSPLHAWANHPRLNPDFKREEQANWDVGTAAHALLLEGNEGVAMIDYPDWRKKEARD